MTQPRLRFTNLALCALLPPLLLACASVADAYARAARIDTIGAYQDFLRRHSSGDAAERARERMAVLQERHRQEKERRARDEAAEWAIAGREPTIARTAAFLERHPDSVQSGAARSQSRRLIGAEALAQAGGQRSAIRPGSTFPARLFTEDDWIRGFGEGTARFIVRYGGDEYTGHNIGFQRIVASAWRGLIDERLRAARGARRVELQVGVVPVAPAIEVHSSADPTLSARVYPHPEPASGEAMLLMVVKRHLLGAPLDGELRLTGSGIVVLRRHGGVEVYEFGAPGSSLLPAP